MGSSPGGGERAGFCGPSWLLAPGDRCDLTAERCSLTLPLRKFCAGHWDTATPSGALGRNREPETACCEQHWAGGGPLHTLEKRL